MPFDLDAVASEVTREPFEFTFGGETYTLSPTFDIRIVGHLTEGEVIEALRLTLGDEQWDQMQASETVLTSEQFKALFDAYMKHCGIDAGEASASTGSSRSTGRPSKRTSSGSTASSSRNSSRAR